MSFLVYLFLFPFLFLYIQKVLKSSYNNPEIAIKRKKIRFMMILKSFTLGNLISLCINIINLVIMIRLNYRFFFHNFYGTFLFLSYPSLDYRKRRRRHREELIINNKFSYGATTHDIHINLLCTSIYSIG
jgi:hypothetical protein